MISSDFDQYDLPPLPLPLGPDGTFTAEQKAIYAQAVEAWRIEARAIGWEVHLAPGRVLYFTDWATAQEQCEALSPQLGMTLLPVPVFRDGCSV